MAARVKGFAAMANEVFSNESFDPRQLKRELNNIIYAEHVRRILGRDAIAATTEVTKGVLVNHKVVEGKG
jgi:hypothetical protein